MSSVKKHQAAMGKSINGWGEVNTGSINSPPKEVCYIEKRKEMIAREIFLFLFCLQMGDVIEYLYKDENVQVKKKKFNNVKEER